MPTKQADDAPSKEERLIEMRVKYPAFVYSALTLPVSLTPGFLDSLIDQPTDDLLPTGSIVFLDD